VFLRPGRIPTVCNLCPRRSEGQAVVGMIILSGVRRSGDGYSTGRILDPRRGTSVKCRIALPMTGAKLEVRGFIGIPPSAGPRPGFARVSLLRPALRALERTVTSRRTPRPHPPCGTSGYWPGRSGSLRVCIFAGFDAPAGLQPAIYSCRRPGKRYRTAATPEPVGNSHSTLPVLASNARNMRSLVPPATAIRRRG